MSKFLFITGTGTNVGKTYIAALIVKKLVDAGINVGYFKPAMSDNKQDSKGNILPGDSLFIKNFAKTNQPVEEMCPYLFTEPYSPHLAAQLNKQSISIPKIHFSLRKLCQKYEYIVIEGAGGVLCPLTYDNGDIYTITNFIGHYNFPCLIVADAGLGTINHLCLTIDYLQTLNINVQGFVLNNYQKNNLLHTDNLKMCHSMTNLEAVACIKQNENHFPLAVNELLNYFS